MKMSKLNAMRRITKLTKEVADVLEIIDMTGSQDLNKMYLGFVKEISVLSAYVSE